MQKKNFVWAKGDVNENNQIILTDGNPLSGVYQPRRHGNRILRSHRRKNIEAELEGDIIRLSVKADGLYKGVGVKLPTTKAMYIQARK